VTPLSSPNQLGPATCRLVVAEVLLVLAFGVEVEAAGVAYLDGRETEARPLEIRDGALRLEGVPEPVPLEELASIVFSTAADTAEADAAKGPLVVFREGETLAARVAKSGSGSVTLAAESWSVEAPTEALRAFRLREAHTSDDLFETDLQGPPPSRDIVYVRRGASLLKVEGVFRGLDDEFLLLEYEGQVRRLKRQLVQGVLFAPVASRAPDAGIPAVLDLGRGNQLPVFVEGLAQAPATAEAATKSSGATLSFRFAGAPRDAVQRIACDRVLRVRFSSDRVLYLSAALPATVDEVPALGAKPPFPWKKDAAASGGAMTLGGKVYRKGLGVCSRSVLEYDLGEKYRTFAATIGLDDAAGPTAGVDFLVIADGKEIFRKSMARSSKPESVLLPMSGVKRLRLEVGYGEDGMSFGDYADWADARVTK
jgi:hypothetical protein